LSTAKYLPLQTQNRANIQETEQFLQEVNQPLIEWEKEYETLVRGSGIYLCIAIVGVIIFPIFFFLICWRNSSLKKVNKAQDIAIEKAKAIVKEKNEMWNSQGLHWNTRQHFPMWIELWTSFGGGAEQNNFEPVLCDMNHFNAKDTNLNARADLYKI